MKKNTNPVCHTQILFSQHTTDSTCHTERSEVSHNAVSTKESRFFANAQNDKRETTQNDNRLQT